MLSAQAATRQRNHRSQLQAEYSSGTRSRTEVEHAVVRWVGWYNNERIHTSIGDMPPTEYEDLYYGVINTPTAA
jgi:transposase InsO family protein